MSSFLILDPRPVYFTSTGAVAAGGSLKFFAAGTDTPQDVYGDSDLSTNNGAVLALGTDGRSSVDVWGDGTNAYRVQLFDSNGSLVFDVDNVGLPGGTGNQIPTLESGKFLSNDGSVLVWTDMLSVPDPTGQDGKVLSTDGTNLTWVAKPADGAAGTNASVTVGSTAFKWNGGTGSFALIQMGSSTATAGGGKTTSKAITFPTAFAAAPTVMITPNNGPCADSTIYARAIASSISATGFTANFSTKTGGTSADSQSTSNIINDIDFEWVAFGTVAS